MGLRSIAWQLKIEGQQPGDMTQKLLCLGYGVAQHVYIHLHNPSPYALAVASWGLSGFALNNACPDKRITLVLANKSAPNLAEPNPDWINVRLGWLGHLVDSGKLSMVVYDEEIEVPDDMPPHFSSAHAVIAANDECGDIVSWALFDGPSSVDAEFLWSYGDPAKRAKRVFDGTGAVATSLMNNAADVVQGWLNLLRAHDKGPATEWAEIFPSTAPLTEDRPLYAHQEEAIVAWLARNGRGIFKFCTGGGKTLAALRAIKAMKNAEFPPCPVIVTVPTRILGDQWQNEIKLEGFGRALEAYNNKLDWIEYLDAYLTHTEQPKFIVTTYTTFTSAPFQNILANTGNDVHAVWIADEMHNITSTARLRAMEQSKRIFKYRIGLSATPEVESDMNITTRLFNFFGPLCKAYELPDGIRDGVLCPYRYYPQPVFLSPDLGLQYLANLKQIEEKPNLVDLYRQNRELVRTSGVQINAFNDILNVLPEDFSHTLVYCPPGYSGKATEVDEDSDDDDEKPQAESRRLVEDVITRLQEKNVSVSSILGSTLQAVRLDILKRFKRGDVRTICAIGCLDEGVDVPAIKRAIILYSHDSDKQFVQRRGRILRKDKLDTNKVAEIRDVVVLPYGTKMPKAEKERLLEREMRRYRVFSALATNKPEAEAELNRALDQVRDK